MTIKTKNISKTIFSCQACGYESSRWLGKCPGCGDWNSFVEEKQQPNVQQVGNRGMLSSLSTAPILLADIKGEHQLRYQTGMGEFDRVLGGGVVQGSVTLIGGDPGIGKSTIALQAGCKLSQQGKKVLYISGEESVTQTKMRADRIIKGAPASLYIVNQIDINVIIEAVSTMNPDVVVIDSIQVVYDSLLASSPGSVSQVRECAAVLTQLAKTKNIALFIIGHVTKEGSIAGPRVLEHIVDTVLYFEGERYSAYRVLRAVKNRFGSTNEMGVFEMTSEGLMEVLNPSEIFLSERAKNTSGSVVTPILEGTRPFLVEVQGLVSRSAFGMVRHKAQGFDVNRLALLVAVLEKRLGIRLEDQDVFLNIVGGVKVVDPAVDLAVALSVASSFLDRPLSCEMVVFGEVGLSAEVRSVSQIMLRLQEAEKLGFKKCILPKNNLKNRQKIQTKTMELLPVSCVKEALDCL